MIKLPYYICEFCNQPIKIHKFKRHREKVHSSKISKKCDLERSKKILNESKKSDPSEGHNPLSLWFELAKRVFSEIEGIDTSNYTYAYDYQVKKLLERATPTTHAPYPPTMMHVKAVVRDQKIYDQLLKKYKGTEMGKALKELMKGVPVVIVCKENYANLVLEWRRKGWSVSEIMFLTVFFYLDEVYHIMGMEKEMLMLKPPMLF